MSDADVIVIGAGGGGAVIAKELGELGLKVLVLEAGPWYGNKKWPNPNQERGGKSSSSVADLDIHIYKKMFDKFEGNMNDLVSGRYHFGPADRRRPPWFRNIQGRGVFWQNSGVGGTTQHYWGNSPRAYPAAVDNIWPISYGELIPYFEKVEDTLPVHFAPTTSKEEFFYYGVSKAGWSLIPTFDVTTPGYRPEPNAILPPNQNLMNPNYSLEQLSWMEGCTLCGHCVNGCPHGPSIDKIAKRSTTVSYVPLALKTGNVEIRPNAYTVKILTAPDPVDGLRAYGVQIRDTWTGEMDELTANVIVMAAGCVETPRLWLNSGLPHNPWVGRGLTNHYFDFVTGIFDEKDLLQILGKPEIDSFMGPTSGARLDLPGLGMIEVAGLSPGLTASFTYGSSRLGFSLLRNKGGSTAFEQGRVVGNELKDYMRDYRRTFHLLVITDDEVDQRNGITVDPFIQDEHGPVPVIKYAPSKRTLENRERLVKIAIDILQKAGARKMIRSDWPATTFIHLESTMRMGFVVDTNCEAYQVKRLFISDNSVHFNSIGGPNPTLTTQALATRTSEKIAAAYF